MAWVKLDDRFPDNPKIAELSDAAFRAYVTSICYAARELTDGALPANKAKEYARRPRVIQELVPGLWEPAGKGFVVHDYLKYNPTREQVTADREAARRRMFGRSSAELRPKEQRSSAVGSEAPVDPVPRSPDPDPVSLFEKGAKPRKERVNGRDERAPDSSVQAKRFDTERMAGGV